jgi:hypothetical protein
LTATAEVGVVEHDAGRFAAEFQRHALDGIGGELRDTLAGAVEPVKDTMSTSDASPALRRSPGP